MKRFLYAVALLLGLSVLFVSCNKDNGGTDGNYAKLIIGTWQEEAPGNHIYEFRTDGTYVCRYINYDTPIGPFSYKINGNRLESPLTYIIIQKLTETEMVWEYPTIGETTSFKRVE